MKAEDAMFPGVIDNTMRKTFSACPHQFMRRFVQGIVPIAPPSVDLHFGACFAKGVEAARKAYWQEDDQLNAVEVGVAGATEAWGAFMPPEKSNKTLAKLIVALRYYFEQWALASDWLKPVSDGIECSFAIELPFTHPDTGVPLRYAGRYDMLAQVGENTLYVVDEKTTSKFTDAWFMQWDLDSQMSGYIWSVLQDPAYAGCEVRAQLRGISISKYDCGHAEVTILRPKWMLDMWYEQLTYDVVRMLSCYETGAWDRALGPPCVAYARPCDYAQLCKSPNPERLIEGNYKENLWNPLNKQ